MEAHLCCCRVCVWKCPAYDSQRCLSFLHMAVHQMHMESHVTALLQYLLAVQTDVVTFGWWLVRTVTAAVGSPSWILLDYLAPEVICVPQ
jgi:hypothetical protein